MNKKEKDSNGTSEIKITIHERSEEGMVTEVQLQNVNNIEAIFLLDMVHADLVEKTKSKAKFGFRKTGKGGGDISRIAKQIDDLGIEDLEIS